MRCAYVTSVGRANVEKWFVLCCIVAKIWWPGVAGQEGKEGRSTARARAGAKAESGSRLREFGANAK